MAKIYDYAITEPRITSDFGWRTHPITGKRTHHDGVDLVSNVGNRNLFAIEDGYVQQTVTNQSGATTGYGNRVWIRYPRINKSVMYAHCEKVYVKKGDNVKKGDVVAYEGKTGAATGVHLHFGMTDIGSDEWINPQTYDYQPPYDESIIIKPVERDENKDQLKVLVVNLEVRFAPSLDSEVRGHVQTDKIYNYKGTAKNNGYTWYQIDDIQWIPDNGKWLDVYPRKDSGDIEQLKKEIDKTNKKIKELKIRVQEQDKEILNLNAMIKELQQEIDKFRNVYTCEETGTYKFRIKLYKGESLYIK